METYDVGAAIDSLYAFDKNIRIQNLPETGFFGCFPQHPVSPAGLKPEELNEISINKNGNVHTSTDDGINSWYFSKSLKEICRYLIDETAKKTSQIRRYVNKHTRTALESVLTTAHKNGFRFVIDTIPDSGYDVYLFNDKWKAIKLEEYSTYDANELADWINKHTTGKLS